MVKKKNMRKSDDVLELKGEILKRLARRDKKTHIAAQLDCDERYVRDIEKWAKNLDLQVAQQLPQEIQEYIDIVKHQPQRKPKKTKEMQKETQSGKIDPQLAIELYRHWEKLTELASIIVNSWADGYRYGFYDYERGEFILDGKSVYVIDWELGECLVSHLKAEFEEIKNAQRLTDLLGANLKKDNYAILGVLTTIRDRKPFFKGTCPVCESLVSSAIE